MAASDVDPVLKLSSIRPMTEKKARPERFAVTLPSGTKAFVGAKQAARYGNRSAGGAAATSSEGEGDGPEEFNPGDHTIDEVKAYLASRPLDDETEYDRVLEAERTGKARQGLVGE